MAGRPTGIEISKEQFENALQMSGYSKKKLAKEMGIDVRKLQKNINQVGRMSYEDLINACQIMDVDPTYIMIGNYSGGYYSSKKSIVDNVPAGLRNRIDSNGVFICHFGTFLVTQNSNEIEDLLKKIIMAQIKNKKSYNRLSEDDKEKCLRYIFSNLMADEIDGIIRKKIDEYYGSCIQEDE